MQIHQRGRKKIKLRNPLSIHFTCWLVAQKNLASLHPTKEDSSRRDLLLPRAWNALPIKLSVARGRTRKLRLFSPSSPLRSTQTRDIYSLQISSGSTNNTSEIENMKTSSNNFVNIRKERSDDNAHAKSLFLLSALAELTLSSGQTRAAARVCCCFFFCVVLIELSFIIWYALKRIIFGHDELAVPHNLGGRPIVIQRTSSSLRLHDCTPTLQHIHMYADVNV